jgi:hypothetical protein
MTQPSAKKGMTNVEEITTAVIAQKLIRFALEEPGAFGVLTRNLVAQDRFIHRTEPQYALAKKMQEHGLMQEKQKTINPDLFKAALAMDADRVDELCKRAKKITHHMVEASKLVPA